MCVSLALALLCAVGITHAHAHAHAHAHDKRAESESGIVSPVPFTFAARYGRSPERFITPRNDRWMLTTRYGKRSDSFTMEEDPPTFGQSPPLAGSTEEGGRRLSCEYTGVLKLYRCTRRDERARLTRRSDDDPATRNEPRLK